MEDPVADPFERARNLLSALVRISGLSRQALDEKLGLGRGFTSQVLTGRVKLRFEHVLNIVDALGLDPAVFFALLYPIPTDDRVRRSMVADLSARLRLAGFELQPGNPSPLPFDPVQDELVRVVRAEVEKYFKDREAHSAPRRARDERS